MVNKMKKGFLITYIGAALTCLITALSVNKTAKKYGQAPHRKKGINIYELFGAAEKIYDTITEMKESPEK